jgi:outer membrane protein OmpA-like peptidoglycan-associated protein
MVERRLSLKDITVSLGTFFDHLGTWTNRFVPMLTVALTLFIIPYAVKEMRPEKHSAPVVFWPDSPVQSISIPADTLFEFGKSTLTEDGRARIKAVAANIAALAMNGVMVVGHTDHFGPAQENQRLSTARALEVRKELVKTIDPTLVTYVGVGSRSPLTKNGECPGAMRTKETLECNAKDRRVEIWTRTQRQ